MRKCLKALILVCVLAILSYVPIASAQAESDDPIKITWHDWTGQFITATLIGEMLKSMGYNIEYVPADYIAQFVGLESGDLHVAVEIWETTGKDALEASLATGNTVDLGETGMDAIEEWWYPLYMKEKCPGLPDWTALNGCAEAFSTPETHPRGRYLGGALLLGAAMTMSEQNRLVWIMKSFMPGQMPHCSRRLNLRISVRRPSWRGYMRLTGHPRSMKVSGLTFQFTRTSVTRTPRGEAILIWPMTAASLAAGSKQLDGSAAKKNGQKLIRQFETLPLTMI